MPPMARESDQSSNTGSALELVLRYVSVLSVPSNIEEGPTEFISPWLAPFEIR
jgi:hypothetical protein